MITLQPERMSKAIEKAKRVRNHVSMIAFRMYEVRTPENRIYTVKFESQEGKKLAACNCAAGAKGQACYHIASAIVLHLAIAKLRHDEEKAAKRATEQKPVERKKAGRKVRPVLTRKECNHAGCKTTRCAEGASFEGIAI